MLREWITPWCPRAGSGRSVAAVCRGSNEASTTGSNSALTHVIRWSATPGGVEIAYTGIV